MRRPRSSGGKATGHDRGAPASRWMSEEGRETFDASCGDPNFRKCTRRSRSLATLLECCRPEVLVARIPANGAYRIVV